jgi:hypothetical protein
MKSARSSAFFIREYEAYSRQELLGAIIDGDAVGAISSVEEGTEIASPAAPKLFQDYRNPFDSNTQIEYTLPFRSKVVLKVFNVLGQEVRTLVEDVREAGSYVVTFDGSALASGLYFYSLHATGADRQFVQTKSCCC